MPALTDLATLALDALHSPETHSWASLVDLLPERPWSTGGAPSLLTRGRAHRLCQAVRDGNYVDTAARLAGISRDAMHEWMRKGDAHPTDTNWQYVTLRHAVLAAEAEAEDESIRSIRAAGSKDWKASASWVGRRHRERWSEQYSGGESGKAHVVINVGIALPGVAHAVQVLDAQIDSVPELSAPQSDVTAIISPSPAPSPHPDGDDA